MASRSVTQYCCDGCLKKEVGRSYAMDEDGPPHGWSRLTYTDVTQTGTPIAREVRKDLCFDCTKTMSASISLALSAVLNPYGAKSS